MAGELEQLAYEAALRGLDKQENLLEELRARTGVLLAASALTASFLGQRLFANPEPPGLAILALIAFVVSFTMSVLLLLPKHDLAFAEAVPALYEGLYEVRGDLPEVYRRLAYAIDRLSDANEGAIDRLARRYVVAALALIVETVLLATALGDILV